MSVKKNNVDSKKNRKNNKTVLQTNPLLEKFEHQTLWHLVLLVLLPFFVYIKTVGYDIIDFDDVEIIRNIFDPITGRVKNILNAFTTDAFGYTHGDYYRPLQTLTLMFDSILGGGKIWLYHLSNLLYHLLTVVSLYYLLRLLNIKNLTALFVVLVFSVHPLLSSAVSWIPARGDMLIGLFGVLVFSTFITYTTTQKPIFFILHSLSFLLAVFSKETALLLPFLLLFYHFKVTNKPFEKANIKTLIPFLMVWLGVFVCFYLLRSKVVTATPPDSIFGFKPFIDNLEAIPTIIGKFILPISLSTMPLFSSTATFVGSFVLLVALWIVVKAVKQKRWLTVMGFVWFLLFIIPPMFFKLYYSQFVLEYYEHRTYLPLIGLIIMLAVGIETYRKEHTFPIPFAAIVIVVFTFLASMHSDNFKDSLAFFTNATERGNPFACTRRGAYYMEQRDFPNAIKDFNLAIKLSRGEYAPAFYNRGLYYATAAKDHAAAEADLSRTVAIDNRYIDAYIKRASERIFSSNFEGALNDLDLAKSIDSTNVEIYYTKAKVYTSALMFDASLPFYNKAIAMYPNSPEMYNDRAYARYRVGDYKGALKDCNQATLLMPNFMSAYYNKGIIYLELGKPDIAIKELDTTLMLTDNFYFGYFYRGMAKKQLKDMKGACEDWQESVRLGFTMAEDTIRKYCK